MLNLKSPAYLMAGLFNYDSTAGRLLRARKILLFSFGLVLDSNSLVS
jgi:hypothetical protein